jgi:hypothetical protein
MIAGASSSPMRSARSSRSARVVVAVVGEHVEHRAAVLLLQGGLAEVQLAHDGEELRVAVGAGPVEVEVGQGAEREHVDLAAVIVAVEAPGHEVRAAALLEQAAGAHRDAGRG